MSFKIKSVERENKSSILQPGQHVVKVTTVAETNSKASSNWNDVTPQVEVVVKNSKGDSLTIWYNLKGYMRESDYPKGAPKGIEFRSSENGNEGYAVNIKTDERIESESRTADCDKIIGEFANDCGIKAGTEGTLEQKTVGIMVRENSRGFMEMHYTMPASKVKVATEADA